MGRLGGRFCEHVEEKVDDGGAHERRTGGKEVEGFAFLRCIADGGFVGHGVAPRGWVDDGRERD